MLGLAWLVWGWAGPAGPGLWGLGLIGPALGWAGPAGLGLIGPRVSIFFNNCGQLPTPVTDAFGVGMFVGIFRRM